MIHTSAPLQVLEEKDIIVEFMHVHWGLKGANPVNRVSTDVMDLPLRHTPASRA